MLAFGVDHSVLLHRQQVYTSGDNLFAQLLRPSTEGMQKTGKTAHGIACSAYSTYILREDGVYRSGPYRRIVNEEVRSFVANEDFHAYLTSHGEYRDSEGVVVAGTYDKLRMRGDYLAISDTRGKVSLLAPVTSIAQPALDFDVTTNALWLVTPRGQCYSGDRLYTLPVKVTAVACGNQHVLVLSEDGSVWSQGSDQWGQLGTGERVDGTRRHFAAVEGLTSIEQIFAGEDMSAALSTGGKWYVWGRNDMQQLGLTSPYEGIVAPTLLVEGSFSKKNTYSRTTYH